MTDLETRRLAAAELLYKQEVDRIDRESRDDYGNERNLAMSRALKAADHVDMREGVHRVSIGKATLERVAFVLYKQDNYGKPTEWPPAEDCGNLTLEQFKAVYIELARPIIEAIKETS